MTEVNVKKIEDGKYLVSKVINVEYVCANADEICEAVENISQYEGLAPSGTEQE